MIARNSDFASVAATAASRAACRLWPSSISCLVDRTASPTARTRRPVPRMIVANASQTEIAGRSEYSSAISTPSAQDMATAGTTREMTDWTGAAGRGGDPDFHPASANNNSAGGQTLSAKDPRTTVSVATSTTTNAFATDIAEKAVVMNHQTRDGRRPSTVTAPSRIATSTSMPTG